MGDAPLLTRAALDALEEAIRDKDPDLASRLAPGLAETEVERMTEALGISLSDEARLWWAWHDGVHAATVTERILGAGFQLLPLTDAVELYRVSRGIAESERTTIGDDTLWNPAWFPLVGRGSATVTCDCAEDRHGPTAIRIIDFEAIEPGSDRPRARSLGEMVAWWQEAIEDGAWYHTRSGWDYKTELLDPVRRASGLV